MALVEGQTHRSLGQTENPEIDPHIYSQLRLTDSKSVGEGRPFQQTVLEQVDIFRQKNEPQHKLTPCTKINSKWITDLTIKCKIIKLIEKNRKKSLESRAKQRVLRLDTQSMIHKEQMDKLDF